MSGNIQQVDSSRGTPRGQGTPRSQRAVRDQVRIEMRSLDQLLPAGDQARVVWEFVGKLDLSEYYADIRAVEGPVGRSPVDPAILLSLWLLATLDGIGWRPRWNAARKETARRPAVRRPTPMRGA